MSRKTLFILLKALLAIAILAVIGRQFYRDLTSDEIRSIAFHPGWLVVSAALYIIGLATWGLFWYRLMRLFDQQITLPVAMRAYFLGQLGKYIPGKAWALLIRADQASGPGVVFGISIVTAFYEVLTSMAAGALVAAVVFFFEPPVFRGLNFPPYLTGLLLLGGCGVPLLPGVFNLLAQRLAQRFPSLDAFQAPKLSLVVLLQGLALTSIGWIAMGLSLWACLASVIELESLTFGAWAYYAAIMGLAYVLGFAAFVIPGGVGVREWVLREFLRFVPTATSATLAAAVLLLRLTWTAAEIVMGVLLAGTIRRRKLPVKAEIPAPTSPDDRGDNRAAPD